MLELFELLIQGVNSKRYFFNVDPEVWAWTHTTRYADIGYTYQTNHLISYNFLGEFTTNIFY